MKHLLLIALTLFCLASCQDDTLPTSEEQSPVHQTGIDNSTVYVPDVLYVKLTEAAADAPSKTELTARMGATDMRRVFPPAGKFEERSRSMGMHLWYYVYLQKNTKMTRAVNELSSIPEVEFVEPVPRTTQPQGKIIPIRLASTRSADPVEPVCPFNDAYLNEQWNYNNPGFPVYEIPEGPQIPKLKKGADINLFKAWKITTGSQEVIVSVVDGGIDWRHEDLTANMQINEKELNGLPGVDDDGNGYIDDIYGFNFVDYNETIIPHYHGTHVAGTIAATNNNGIGVCGIAGGDGNGNGARLLSSQIFYSDPNDPEKDIGTEKIPEAIKYGADNGAVISQNSWSYVFNEDEVPEMSQVARIAIDYFIKYAGIDENGVQTGPMKGGIIIFAAANNGKEMIAYPAALPEVTAVAAMSYDFKRASYSNYADWVDITAPGGDFYNYDQDKLIPYGMILSTYPDNEYGYTAGTSMAAPHVSGIAALILSKFGKSGFTPDDLRRQLKMGLRDIDKYNPEYAGKLGGGYIDAEACLRTEHHAPQFSAGNTQLELKQVSQTFNLNDFFTDADEDELTYKINAVSPEGTITAQIVDNQLCITAKQYGDAEIEITASDPFKYSCQGKLHLRNLITEYELQCYPNPVSDILYIRFGEEIQGSIGIKLFSVTGIRILETQRTATQFEPISLNLSGLNRGSYTLKLTYNGKETTRNIIKK